MNKSHCVLIVDDEAAIRLNLRIMMEDLGYRAMEAANGLEALQAINRQHPDLVLADLRMPEMDGLSLIATLVRDHPELPVIVISGVGVIQEAIEAVRLGAWDYLAKPVHDENAVKIVIERALERARLMAENRHYRENLEKQVRQRTAELETANLELKEEIAERSRAEQQIREHQQRLNDMALELTLSEERERRRIAIDLHDTLGQDLTLTRMKLGGLDKTALSSEQQKIVAEIKGTTENAINRVRGLTRLLSPPIMESAGLEAALKWLARQIETDYGLQIAFSDDLSDKPIVREFQLELYNCVRELLINVAKHAGTATACLTVCREADTLAIKVEDDGVGFEADAVLNGSNSDGFGLFTISRRIMHLGGTFQIRSQPGSGTEAAINVPLLKQADSHTTTGEQA